MWPGDIIGSSGASIFLNEQGNAVTVNGERCEALIEKPFLWPELEQMAVVPTG